MTILNACDYNFIDLNFSFCEFPFANLKNAYFDGSIFKNTNMIGCDLTESSFANCVFEKTDLRKVETGLVGCVENAHDHIITCL